MKRTRMNHAGSLLLLFAIGGATANVAHGAWTETATLTPSYSAPGNEFGQSVAIQGNIAIVGCPEEDSITGAAYIFVKTGGAWKQEARLVASDAAPFANFGFSVALSGNTVLVGAYGWGGYGVYTGAAYVFVRSGTEWTQQAELNAPDTGQSFGRAVALEGNTALVGNLGFNDKPGAAYVFVRSSTGWDQQATLTASDGQINDEFGSEVALNQDTVLIGAPAEGHAYVFVRTGASWSQQAELLPPSGTTNTGFGTAVALEGETAIVSDTGQEAGGGYGVVLSFSRSGTAWTQGTPLTFPLSSPFSVRGSTLALSGTTLLIGCYTKSSDYVVAVFGLNGSTWSEKAVLAPTSGGQTDEFGVGVAISGGTALIGAPAFDPTAGAAYIFVQTSN